MVVVLHRTAGGGGGSGVGVAVRLSRARCRGTVGVSARRSAVSEWSISRRSSVRCWRNPTLCCTLLNHFLMSPWCFFCLARLTLSAAVGTPSRVSRLESSLIFHIAVAAAKRGLIILSTSCFHLLDLGQGFVVVNSKSRPCCWRW